MSRRVDGVDLIVRWLIELSRGGRSRARILRLLKEKPMNPHQIARELGLNYHTVTRHLEILEKHGLVVRVEKRYGAPYILTGLALEKWDTIRKAMERVGVD
ncbi:MAG: winged helix-turn-helix domain-containing protein [Desulfurococcales archaeon]|nr:winged helix-turn-helix domain-containing protein [Desulfurococcales archaeon]